MSEMFRIDKFETFAPQITFTNASSLYNFRLNSTISNELRKLTLVHDYIDESLEPSNSLLTGNCHFNKKEIKI